MNVSEVSYTNVIGSAADGEYFLVEAPALFEVLREVEHIHGVCETLHKVAVQLLDQKHDLQYGHDTLLVDVALVRCHSRLQQRN